MREDSPSLDSRGFPVSVAFLNASQALDTLVSAFLSVQVLFDPSSEKDRQLYLWLCTLATWSYAPPDELRFQDAESRKKVELVLDLARQLRTALIEAWEYANNDDDGERVNVCQFIFDDDESFSEYEFDLAFFEMGLEGALAQGLVPGKGRPPLHLFSSFVRGLHRIYMEKVGKKGFSERGASAEGDFIDLVFLAQGILPTELQHADKNTIGNRVLAAFGGKSSKKKI